MTYTSSVKKLKIERGSEMMSSLPNSPRVAIYARYSSDLQRATSIEDQVALCRRRAIDLGASTIEIFSDAAVSGSGIHDRPGYRSLLDAARLRRFDVLVVEALDRVSRDQADTATAFKVFRFADCRIHSVNEGEIGAIHIGMKGAMNSLYLEDLAHRVRRGQRGALERGRIPAGLSFGYRPAPILRPDGTVDRGHRTIVEAEAEVVRRIFREYSAGLSPRAIAARLNADGIQSPRGRKWNASTLNGSKARASGILYNPVYVGGIILNRQAFRKNPDTGKRVPKINDRHDWIRVEHAELAIVDRETWDLVQARKLAFASRPFHMQRSPKKLLSGLVFCGKCGSAMTTHSKTRLGCVGMRERGSCDNRRAVSYPELEARVLAGLKDQLLAPEAVKTFVDEYRGERKRLAADRVRRTTEFETEIAGIQRQIENLVDVIAGGAGDVGPIVARLRDLEARKSKIAAELATVSPFPESVIEFHPDLPDRYRRLVDRLSGVLATDAALQASGRDAVAALVARIEIEPGPARGEYEIVIYGRLAGLLEAAGVPGIVEASRLASNDCKTGSGGGI